MKQIRMIAKRKKSEDEGRQLTTEELRRERLPRAVRGKKESLKSGKGV